MVLGVIQARMGSTRLPGKVLAPILGKPMIWRIFERVLQSRYMDKTVIATTIEPSDDELARFAEQNDIGYYRGSVDDIVDRLCGTAQYFRADVLVRIWGDCPFADPEVIDQAVEKLLAENLDYVSNVIPGERTFPAGLDVEVYRRQILESIQVETEDEFYREFPFEYITRYPEQFRWGIIRNGEDQSHIYLTVDYPQDLELARAIYAQFYRPDKLFSFREVVAFMQKHPDMVKDGANLPRNTDYLQKRRDHQ